MRKKIKEIQMDGAILKRVCCRVYYKSSQRGEIREKRKRRT